MTKHTPGPWSIKATEALYTIVGADSVNVVKTSWHERIRSPYPLQAESYANVCLIAAAPELLADSAFLLDRLDEFERLLACEADSREFYGHVSPAMARLRAALAKAEGAKP